MTYPVPPIPESNDLAGNYYAEVVRMVHTGIEFEDLIAWMRGRPFLIDNELRVVISACDYEGWLDLRRRQGYRIEADHIGEIPS